MERVPVVTNDGIYGFFGEFRYLSNFHLCNVQTADGLVFSSSEAAYMAQKTIDPEIRRSFLWLPPAEARRLGQTITLRTDWDVFRVVAMYDVVLRKFSQNQNLRVLLNATGNKYLEESNNWSDNFWGYDPVSAIHGWGEKDSTGNMLGKILVSVRDYLRHPHFSA